MSERVRGPDRSYGEEEAAEILKRASVKQAEQRPNAAALTLSDLERIAREAGIDPEQVRAAARELDEKAPPPTLGTRLLGASTRISIERRVPRELKLEDHEAVAVEIRRVLGGTTAFNHVSTVGRSLSFSSLSRSGQLEVMVTPRDGETTIRIDAGLGQIAGGIFGGIVGGVGGSVGPNLAWMLPAMLHWPVLSGIGAGVGVIGVTWALCRVIFKRIAGTRREQAKQLADSIEKVIR